MEEERVFDVTDKRKDEKKSSGVGGERGVNDTSEMEETEKGGLGEV